MKNVWTSGEHQRKTEDIKRSGEVVVAEVKVSWWMYQKTGGYREN